jgi:hypothetical protein
MGGRVVSVESELAFQQTIPRRLVHRAAVAEVFVTDAAVVGEDRFVVGAQWPRDHALYHPDAQGRSDPLLFAETIRQALVYLAHWHYGVPLTHRFIGRESELEVTDPDALCVGAEPLAVVLRARWVPLGGSSSRRYEARLEVELCVGSVVCGRGSLWVVMVPERHYRLLRGDVSGRGRVPAMTGGGRQVPPAVVGRLRAKDSVLVSDGPAGQWLLRADPGHAVLFDHATDHLPLMVLLEGVRQLGHLLVHEPGGGQMGQRPWVLAGLDAQCRAWAELDEPTRLVVCEDTDEGPEGRRLGIDVVQGDTVVLAAPG